MPPRKRKGKARKAKGGDGDIEKPASLEFPESGKLCMDMFTKLIKHQIISSNKVGELQLSTEEAPDIDQELLEAQSTIERLAKKYLVSSLQHYSRML